MDKYSAIGMCDKEDGGTSVQETVSNSGSFDLHESNGMAETESLTGLLETATLGSLPEDGESNGFIETESICSLEETAAKIESALRKNLKLDDLRNGSNKPKPAERGRALLTNILVTTRVSYTVYSDKLI